MTAAPHALLTGATGGVGTEVLRLLGAAGWSVTGIHRGDEDRASRARAAWTGSEDRLELRACDLSDEADVAALHEALPVDYCPDAVIHAAAPALSVQPLHRLGWSDFSEQIDGQLKPVVLLTQPLLRRMMRRGHGRVITVLSAVVSGDPPRGFGSYTAAKYAVAAYMKSLAVEYADRGIIASTVAPGPMNTAQLRNLPELLREQLRTSAGPGGWVDPVAVARTIMWLAAEAGPEINGCNVAVTSGMAGDEAPSYGVVRR